MKITLGVVLAIWVFDIVLISTGFIVNRDSGFMTPVPVSRNAECVVSMTPI